MTLRTGRTCRRCGTGIDSLPIFMGTCDACLEIDLRETLGTEEYERRSRIWAFLDSPLGAAVPEREHQQRPGENNEPDPVRHARQAEALDYCANYRGTWGLPLDIRNDRRWGTKWMRLSDRQIEVLLAGKARDEARIKERKQTGRNLHVLPYGRTYAAVDNDEGSVTFLIFDRPEVLDRNKQPNKWHGWVFVKQFIGGTGEGQRLGSQRPNETYVGQWANLVDRVLADPKAAVQRFGHELGICGVCNLPLTNAESREYGIGPVCRKRMEEAEAAFAGED